MPKRATYRPIVSWKRKYHEKAVSEDGIYTTFIRALDVEPYFAEYTWVQLPVFDLSEFGMSLLYAILPIEYQPLTVDFEYARPTPEETLQGVWARFEPVRFDKLYIWMTDFREYVIENIKVEYQPDILIGIVQKAVYGVTPYGRGVYDPIVAREFLRSTFQKLRLMRLPDFHYASMLDQIVMLLEMVGITDEHVFNRLMMMFSTQTNSFLLGLSLLGRSRLTEIEGEYGKVPVKDAKGNVYELKFRTMDHVHLGFILGMAPLSYGLLLPKVSIYSLPEGKRNPMFIKVVQEKTRGIIYRLTLLPWSYANYNRPEEMLDYHKSDKANQYALIQSMRKFVEDWVYGRIPPEESNSVRIRQYQNAVLQLVFFKAKRHRWGFQGWEAMEEAQFKSWWKGYWKGQGLNEATLDGLYEGIRPWLKRLRELRLDIGERVKQRRLRLALAV